MWGTFISSSSSRPVAPVLSRILRRYLSTTTDKTRLITYLTDVEGDAAYLNRYVDNSRVLEFQADQETMDFQDETSMLVYGGDVWDKGGSDLKVIRQLLQLKSRYPDRVHFILGNRDINKMRIWQEVMAEKHDGVWWSKDTPDPEWTKPQRLQWILAKTMGSPNAFEFRRNELGGVSDEEVTQSYLDSCHPTTGEMGRYLAQGHLALKIGQLIILHGALPWMTREENPKYELGMPWLQAPPSQLSALDWIESLNDFARSQVEQWSLHVEQHTPSNGVWSTKGGFDYWPPDDPSPHRYSGLLQYGMGWLPPRQRIPTVVYSSWMQEGMPRKFFDPSSDFRKHTARFMDDANVQVILSGHQPQGDMPTPIRLEEDKLVICCDTSYSGDVEWPEAPTTPLGCRGPLAVCEVLIEQESNAGGRVMNVTTHGTLSNGMSFESANLLQGRDTGVLALDGQPDENRPWWIKCKLKGGSQLLSTAKGFQVVNAITTIPQ